MPCAARHLAAGIPDIAPARLSVWLAAAILAAAAVVKTGWVADLDAALTDWMLARVSPALDAAAQTVTFFGSNVCVLGAMAAWSLWELRQGERRLPVLLWTAWAAGALVQVLLRYAVAQWRPDSGGMPEPSSLFERYELAGFTSGHGYRAAFLFGAAALASMRQGWGWAAVGCALLIAGVGATRVYLIRHWMTDVLGSWLVAAWALALFAHWTAAA